MPPLPPVSLGTHSLTPHLTYSHPTTPHITRRLVLSSIFEVEDIIILSPSSSRSALIQAGAGQWVIFRKLILPTIDLYSDAVS